jgi:glycosyltransferase involved in cell wall biosynthesis
VRRLARDLRAWRADVVQGYGFYTNLPALLAACLARVPVRVAGQRGFNSHLRPAQRRVDRLVRRLAQVTVVNAHAIARRLRAEGEGRPVVVIPNGVPERGEAAPIQDLVVGMVANFRAPKDHATFLRAAVLVAEKVPIAEFHLVGAGAGEAQARALVAQLGLGERVRFLGSLPPDAVWDALDRFGVAVLSSLSEGMPNTVLEAMLAGRPVVATAVGGVPELVQDGVTGYLVPPRDASAMASPIAHLLKDLPLAARLGEAGRAYVSAAFGVDRMVDDYLRLWRVCAAWKAAA